VVITASDEFLSPEEVGDRLGVSVYTVRRWIKTGQLRAFKPGKEYRVQASDLEEFLRAREVRPKLQGPQSDPGQRSFNNHLRDEQRGDWDAAVHNAHQLRQDGQARMEALLSSWRARRDRRALHEMGLLLQEAFDARSALQENASVPAIDRIPLDRIPIPEWEEIAEADRFYGALIDMVFGAGLSIRRGRKAHEVKNAA
jgi:excisionase family DNA binding protein